MSRRLPKVSQNRTDATEIGSLWSITKTQDASAVKHDLEIAPFADSSAGGADFAHSRGKVCLI